MPGRREPQQYQKIASFLRGEISSGRLGVGDLLPSEAELCEQFQTSRGPVRQAMAELRSEGTISSGRGRRSVVLGNFSSESFEASYSVAQRYKEAGFTLEQKIHWLARRPAPREVAEALGVKEGDPIVYIHRTRQRAGQTRLIQEEYFPLEVGRHILDFDESEPSLHAVLARAGIEVDNLSRQLRARPATPEEAETLELDEGLPVFEVTTRLHNHNGDPIEYGVYVFPADRMQMQMNAIRGAGSPLRFTLQSPTE